MWLKDIAPRVAIAWLAHSVRALDLLNLGGLLHPHWDGAVSAGMPLRRRRPEFDVGYIVEEAAALAADAELMTGPAADDLRSVARRLDEHCAAGLASSSRRREAALAAMKAAMICVTGDLVPPQPPDLPGRWWRRWQPPGFALAAMAVRIPGHEGSVRLGVRGVDPYQAVSPTGLANRFERVMLGVQLLNLRIAGKVRGPGGIVVVRRPQRHNDHGERVDP
jgi:hypothetical protein